MTSREQFLITMYGSMWDNINRHIGVIWHSVAVLLGAFAVFGLVEKQVMPVDFAAALIVIVSVWQIAHVFDASYWVNRNLLILRNIECQFLDHSDLKEIHYYFRKARRWSMIEHFKIQLALGVVVILLTLLYHVTKQGIPTGLRSPAELSKALPYAALIPGVIGVLVIRFKQARAYRGLAKESPGVAIKPGEPTQTYGGG